MNQAIKTQWVAALRSGDYKQGQEALRTEDGFCCLGVLCDLAVKAGAAAWSKPREQWISGLHFQTVYKCDSEQGVLPSSVSEWAGLESSTPEVSFELGTPAHPHAGRHPLTQINDHWRRRFDVIADLIEAQL
jgi:hypothetical protein